VRDDIGDGPSSWKDMYPLPPFLLPTIYQFSGERREKATGFVLETDGRSTDPTAIYRNVCSAACILIDLSQPLKIEPLGNNSCEERLHGYTTRQKKITAALVIAARFQFHNFFVEMSWIYRRAVECFSHEPRAGYIYIYIV
jgi:hypothetical protein